MPNIRGGKGYKSGKGKSKLGEDEVVYLERQPDQMVGRIVRLLGDLNTSVFCQDKKQRVCKICRSVKKSVRFEVGDIVLISLRDCEVPKAELEQGVRGTRGDILDRYHPYQYSELKKEGITPHLFGNIDNVTEISRFLEKGDEAGANKFTAKLDAAADEDCFDRDEAGSDEEEEEGENGESERDKRKREGVVVDKKDKVSHRDKVKEISLDDL